MIGDRPETGWCFAAALRGGNWDNSTNAGVFAFNVNNAPSNWNNNIGFRCCSSNIPTTFGGGYWPEPCTFCKSAGVSHWDYRSVTCFCGLLLFRDRGLQNKQEKSSRELVVLSGRTLTAGKSRK